MESPYDMEIENRIKQIRMEESFKKDPERYELSLRQQYFLMDRARRLYGHIASNGSR
jgi:hypothetical protein